VVLVCTSFLLHYVANSMLWSYADRIGVSHHVSVSILKWAFAGSMISGVVGAIAATVWGRRFSLPAGIYTGIGLISLAAILFLSPLAVLFVAAVLLMNLAIMFVVPAYLGFLAQAEGGEDAVTLGNLASFVGLMAGPAVGSRLIVQGSFAPVAIAGLILFVLAFLIAWMGVKAMQQTGSGTECDPGPNTMVRGDLKL
jgi:predicted MFS family arabinose efflux permease